MRTLRLCRYAWVLRRNAEPSVWAICGNLRVHDLWCAFRRDVTLTELMASVPCARGALIVEI